MTFPPINYGPMDNEERHRRNVVWLKAFRDSKNKRRKAIEAAEKAVAWMPLPKTKQNTQP